MKAWGFSWRSAGAGLGASAIGGAVFALICGWADVSVDPADASEYPGALVVIWAVGAASLLLAGGAVWLSASLLALRWRWPRPWLEALVLAALLYTLAHIGPFTVNVGNASGVVSPWKNFAAFAVEFFSTPLAGLIATVAYWRLAARPVASA